MFDYRVINIPHIEFQYEDPLSPSPHALDGITTAANNRKSYVTRYIIDLYGYDLIGTANKISNNDDMINKVVRNVEAYNIHRARTHDLMHKDGLIHRDKRYPAFHALAPYLSECFENNQLPDKGTVDKIMTTDKLRAQ